MNLSDRALLVDLFIACWPGVVTDKRATDEVQKFNKANANSGKYQKLLCRSGGLLNNIHNKGVEIRNLHKHMTSPWEDGGKRVVSTELYVLKYRTAMLSAVSELEAMFPEFTAKYPELVEADREIHGDLWKAEDYPQTVSHRFDIRIGASPIPNPQDFRLSMSEELANDLQASYQREIDEKLKNVTKDAWERLAASTRKLQETIAEYGPGKRLRSSLFTNLDETASILKGLNLNQDSQLNSMADEVQSLLKGLMVDNLKESPESRSVAADQFQAVLDRMQQYI